MGGIAVVEYRESPTNIIHVHDDPIQIDKGPTIG